MMKKLMQGCCVVSDNVAPHWGTGQGAVATDQSWSSVYRLVTRPGTRNIVTITATQHSVLSRRWEHDPDTCILYYSLTCSVAQIITL